MSTDHRKTWERYTESWKVASPEQKQALLDGSVSPRCVYTDPLTRAEGWSQLIAYMVDFHRQMPGGHFVTRHFAAHHQRSLARWDMLDGAGKVIGDGSSYGEYDETGLLLAMTGFFETPPR